MSAMIIPQALLVYISLEPEHKLTCFSFLFVVYLLYWDLLEHVELKQAAISESEVCSSKSSFTLRHCIKLEGEDQKFSGSKLMCPSKQKHQF